MINCRLALAAGFLSEQLLVATNNSLSPVRVSLTIVLRIFALAGSIISRLSRTAFPSRLLVSSSVNSLAPSPALRHRLSQQTQFLLWNWA